MSFLFFLVGSWRQVVGSKFLFLPSVGDLHSSVVGRCVSRKQSRDQQLVFIELPADAGMSSSSLARALSTYFPMSGHGSTIFNSWIFWDPKFLIIFVSDFASELPVIRFVKHRPNTGLRASRRGKAGVRSAEAVFTSSSMTERLVRKQQSLAGRCCKKMDL